MWEGDGRAEQAAGRFVCFPHVNKTFKPEKLDVVSELSSVIHMQHLTGSQKQMFYVCMCRDHLISVP